MNHARVPARRQFLGVAVDVQCWVQDAATRTAAVRSVGKLRSFMNLGYPVSLDEGSLFGKKFGDPRLLGAGLPFCRGRDRWQDRALSCRPLRCHREAGLKQLDEAVMKASCQIAVTVRLGNQPAR